jgi:hypothetical protein
MSYIYKEEVKPTKVVIGSKCDTCKKETADDSFHHFLAVRFNRDDDNDVYEYDVCSADCFIALLCKLSEMYLDEVAGLPMPLVKSLAHTLKHTIGISPGSVSLIDSLTGKVEHLTLEIERVKHDKESLSDQLKALEIRHQKVKEEYAAIENAKFELKKLKKYLSNLSDL